MIPVALPLLGEVEARAAARAVRSGWVSQGAEVAAFEAEFAAFVGAPHACAVSNCTAALHMALLELGVGPGDEVITVSHSFIAGGNAIRQCGAVPVFVDIEPHGFNIDPALVRRAATARTRAILCVHQVGMPCDLDALGRAADDLGVPLVEDAACAAGSEIRLGGTWQRIGTPAGRVACFSFHPRKVVTTGEGGMLTTSDAKLDAAFRRLRQHGMSVSDAERHHSARVVFETYPRPGFNYRMTDIQAAIGRAQIKRLPGIVARRRALATYYGAALAQVEGVTPPIEPDDCRSNWQSYGIRLAPGIDQRRVMQGLLDRGISTRRGIMNMHQEAAQADALIRAPLPRSEAARDRTILLPLFAQMTHDQQNRVIEALTAVLDTAPAASRAEARSEP